MAQLFAAIEMEITEQKLHHQCLVWVSFDVLYELNNRFTHQVRFIDLILVTDCLHGIPKILR